MSPAASIQESNKAIVRESFERWAPVRAAPLNRFYRASNGRSSARFLFETGQPPVAQAE